MTTYKHILSAVDFSKNAQQVIERVKTLQQQTNAKLSLVHVLELMPIIYQGAFSLPVGVNYEQELENQAKKILEKLATQLKITEENCFLEQGSIKIAITELAKKINADLIVIGAHGHHGIEKLLGSRANAVSHMAECDVLVVRIRE